MSFLKKKKKRKATLLDVIRKFEQLPDEQKQAMIASIKELGESRDLLMIAFGFVLAKQCE